VATVRYLVDDLDKAVTFYVARLGELFEQPW
jgi:catechol 2,3-dioxygenase-like lactoylglutathione lyase family enzyme